jgi:hypothetical protein
MGARQRGREGEGEGGTATVALGGMGSGCYWRRAWSCTAAPSLCSRENCPP